MKNTAVSLDTLELAMEEPFATAVLGRDPFDIEAIHHVWERERYTVGNRAARRAPLVIA